MNVGVSDIRAAYLKISMSVGVSDILARRLIVQ